MKITAVHSGGDWYDAGAECLVLPEGARAALDDELEIFNED